jgi:hypothetical protein
MNAQLVTASELAEWLGVPVSTVLKKSRGRRPIIPRVQFGRAAMFCRATVAAKLGINLQSSPALSASPTFPEPAASPASVSPDRASISA